MKNKILINASNLHSGGGVQVAASFVTELMHLKIHDLEIDIAISSEIKDMVKLNHETLDSKISIIEANTYGLSALTSDFNLTAKNYNLTFTIFGPNYLRVQKGIQIVGFAQLWIIDKSAYHILGKTEAIKTRLKFFIQSLFFRRADKLIVELDHVKDGVIKAGIAKPENIDVVYNCISSLYFDPVIWEPLKKPISKRKFSIGFLGRDYPHKNTNLITEIRRILAQNHAIDVDFFVTLNDSEWAAKSDFFKKSTINVGPLSVAQCPSFYQAMDAVIFPSLLECFSATPLEAMAMQKPLFASDRGFVRDVCGDFAWYFDPLNAESAADVIAKYITQRHGKDQGRLAAAREHVLNFSNARQRAESYLNIMRKALAEKP
ncbi:Glycosyl transferase family 1 [Pseudomonas sp. OF001]|uniref:glycosyltransferase n=1 Tax=Pseudomonas sp. OF001 TaxID=2772300 RepID=UPI001919EC5F|nr:glycosyltransferase [Pseudomonas sp. OF001]CAD5377005.1 Glycosyl transferase family 1 [Pseudomonas sp. OF001]